MIIRITEDLGKKIKNRPPVALPLDANPYADWSARLFTASRTQYIMITNTTSLYTMLMFGKGISSDLIFTSRSTSYMGEFIRADGFELIFEKLVAPSMLSVSFSKALNRSVTGSMNDLEFHAQVLLGENKLSPWDVSFRLNNIPFSYLKYNRPREAFRSLIGTEGPSNPPVSRPRMFFPIFAKSGFVRLPKMEWSPNTNSWDLQESPLTGEEVVWPVSGSGNELRWKWGAESFLQEISHFISRPDQSGKTGVYMKSRMSSDGMFPVTWWDSKLYSATEYGTNLLTKLFGKIADFSFPKALQLVIDSIRASNLGKEGLVLDFFAGSGTTGHAVINLNRADKGSRQYILVEQGEYFDTVTKPRIQKVVYSADWKDGKATAPQTGISHAFKVLKIESYEDTLNNLQLRRTPQQKSLLDTLPPAAQEDYLLRYLLDIESRGSLLSVEHFNKPFACKLKVAVDSAGAYEERTIDLVETFNYLIGLRVKHIDMRQGIGFVLVTGWLPTGEKTLVLWRDVEQVDYETLNRLCDKLAINPADSEFEVVYINGDHNIPAVFTSTEAEGGITKTLKIRQIEPEFLSRMFAGEEG